MRLRSRGPAIAAVLAVAAIVTGCGGDESGGSGGSTDGKTLTVAAWKSYGVDDPWAVKEFERMTGAKVTFVYKTSEDQMLQTLQQGGVGKIDVALANLQYVNAGANRGVFQPVDKAKITTYKDLIPEFANLPSLKVEGQLFGIPWVQGATSLTVNPEEVKPTPTSWDILWDPANKGKVAFYDDPSTAVMTAALYLGEDPQNPNLDKVRDALRRVKANTRLNWASANDWTKAYTSGSVTMGNLWSGLAGTLKDSGEPLEYVFPEEGTVRWGDAWTLVKDAPNPDLAYQWINFMTSEKYFVHWITQPGPDQQLAVPVNAAAVAALPKKDAAKLQAERLVDYDGPAAFQAGVPVERLAEWTKLWEEIKAGA